MTRREWLSSAFFGAQLMLLAACGGDGEDDAEQPQAAPTSDRASLPQPKRERATLAVAALFTGRMPLREATRRWNEGDLAGSADDIELKGAGLSFSLSGNLEADQAAFADVLTAQISAGTAPDLMETSWLLDFPWLFKSNFLQPLDRLIQSDSSNPMERFFPQATQLVRHRQQTMAMPTLVTAGVARYLPDFFSQANVPLPRAGWARDEFVSAAKLLTRDTDSDGAVDQWGFAVSHFYPDWLPFVLHETGRDVIDLETTTVRLAEPASLRGLQYWDELGRVQGIMRHGPEVLASHMRVRRPYRASRTAILFQTVFETSSQDNRALASLPAGPKEGTPLLLFDVLAIPAGAQDAELSYRALIPLSLHIGERSRLPTVTASLQHIVTSSREHIDLVFLEQQREIILNILKTAQPSYLASSNYMNQWLLENLTLPLARGEVDVAQAAQQAQDWLVSYLGE